jgi:phage gpG-like protein
MSGPIDVNIGADGAVLAALALSGRLRDLTGLYSQVAEVFLGRVHKRFDTKTDPDGTPWPSWAPSTARARERKGYTQSANLLRLGNPGLRDSIQAHVSSSGIGIEVGAPYGVFHEQLDGPGKGIIPRRAFLLSANGGLGQGDQDAITTTVRDYFDSLLAGL